MPVPTISVLMPVYNGEKYLIEAIESILNQTYTDFEFIIINDGSSDNSELILRNLLKRDPRIQVISRGNRGLTASLNEGLGYVQGKYIARMDADDVAFPERFVQQITFLEHNPNYVAVGSRVLLIDSEGLPIRPFAQQTNHEEIDAAHMDGKGGAIVHPAVMLRRDALQKIGNYREAMEPAEDLDLFLRLAEIGKLANLPEMLLKYRMQVNSIGHTRRQEQKKAADNALIEAYRRRQIVLPNMLNTGGDRQNSLAAIHRKWAWWSLGAGNIATARKHALLALGKNPTSGQSWKVVACAFRGR